MFKVITRFDTGKFYIVIEGIKTLSEIKQDSKLVFDLHYLGLQIETNEKTPFWYDHLSYRVGMQYRIIKYSRGYYFSAAGYNYPIGVLNKSCLKTRDV